MIKKHIAFKCCREDILITLNTGIGNLTESPFLIVHVGPDLGIGDVAGEDGRDHLGHFFIVIDPNAFLGLESFEKITGDILRQLRASEKAPGENRIYTAGEKEYLCWLERRDKGIPVGEAVQKELVSIRDEFKMNYRFPFE
ncbi:MAG: hypothetical protein EOM14_05515 [Clostridia bacterium]|nr:hypothetical protein [Clostridia bacterium]